MMLRIRISLAASFGALLVLACGSSAPQNSGSAGQTSTVGGMSTSGGASSTSGASSGGTRADTGGAPAGGAVGSAGSSAGAMGGGAAGGSAAAGSTGSSCSKADGVLFCDDFESYATGPAMAANGWTPVTKDGALTIDATHAQGKGALHVHTQANGKAYIEVAGLSPAQNSFFGRMKMWVTAFPTAPDYAHFTMVEASGAEPGVIRPVGGQYIPGMATLWGTGSDGGPTGDWTNWKESAKVESGKWVCVEWQLAASDNQIQVWFDGQLNP